MHKAASLFAVGYDADAISGRGRREWHSSARARCCSAMQTPPHPLALCAYGRKFWGGHGSPCAFRVRSYEKTVAFKTNPRARMG